MANEQHVEWLMEGVAAWNQRREAEDFQPDLSGVRFDARRFKESSLWDPAIDGIDLREANLLGAILEGASLEGTSLWGANLQGANLREADLREANLWGANLRGANLRRANLRRANLWGVRLEGASLWQADVDKVIVHKLDLQSTWARGAQKQLDPPRALVDFRVLGFTQKQLDQAMGDSATRIPDDLTRPDYWEKTHDGSPPYKQPDARQDALPALPEPTGIAVPTRFDGEHATLDPSPPPARSDLGRLHQTLWRDGKRLRGSNALPNASQNLRDAVSDYLSALTERYEDLDQVALGVEGQLLSIKFAAEKPLMDADLGDVAGQIQAMLAAHDLLVDRLPDWRKFLMETEGNDGVPADKIGAVEAALTSITEAWAQLPDHVDARIPEAIRHYWALGKEGAQKGLIASVNGVRDALHGVLTYLWDFTKDVAGRLDEAARATTFSVLKNVLRVTVLDGALHLADLLPWFSLRSDVLTYAQQLLDKLI